MAKNWHTSHWQKGQVTLLQAFGVSGQKFKFPSITAKLPTQQAQSQQVASGSRPPQHAKQYTQAQLQQLWIQAGGDPSKALIASAVAMAESQGKAGANLIDSNGTQDRGLWQINSVHGRLSVYDPIQNARAAVEISNNGTDWTPWVTYKNGDYQKYM